MDINNIFNGYHEYNKMLKEKEVTGLDASDLCEQNDIIDINQNNKINLYEYLVSRQADLGIEGLANDEYNKGDVFLSGLTEVQLAALLETINKNNDDDLNVFELWRYTNTVKEFLGLLKFSEGETPENSFSAINKYLAFFLSSTASQVRLGNPVEVSILQEMTKDSVWQLIEKSAQYAEQSVTHFIDRMSKSPYISDITKPDFDIRDAILQAHLFPNESVYAHSFEPYFLDVPRSSSIAEEFACSVTASNIQENEGMDFTQGRLTWPAPDSGIEKVIEFNVKYLLDGTEKTFIQKILLKTSIAEKIDLDSYDYQKTAEHNRYLLQNMSVDKYFLSEDIKKMVMASENNPENVHFYEEDEGLFLQVNNDLYRVCENISYPDQFPDGNSFETVHLSFLEVGEEDTVHMQIPISELFTVLKDGSYYSSNYSKPPFEGMSIENFNLSLFFNSMKIATDNYIAQEENAEIIGKFDLPRDNSISYIALTPEKYDVITSNTEESLRTLPVVLSNAGYLIKDPLIIKPRSQNEILAKIDLEYSTGVRNFFIKINAHGDEYRIDLGYSFGWNDMKNYLELYPDANFTYYINSCFGGGIRNGALYSLKENPELSKRVNIFLETKPYTYSYEGRLNDSSVVTSIHQVLLEYYLGKGLSFGEAFLKADRKSQEYIPSNPEAIIDGKLFSQLERVPGVRTS